MVQPVVELRLGNCIALPEDVNGTSRLTDWICHLLLTIPALGPTKGICMKRSVSL
jgi:hypothetical protein